jgi:hypothetical protein
MHPRIHLFLAVSSQAFWPVVTAVPASAFAQPCSPGPVGNQLVSDRPDYDPSASCLVVVEGQTYEIKTVNTAFSAQDLGFWQLQPWWSSSATTAGAFRQALGWGLGLPNDFTPNPYEGPVFGTKLVSNGYSNQGEGVCIFESCVSGTFLEASINSISAGNLLHDVNSPRIYAYANGSPVDSPVDPPTNVPGPLPLLGTAAAWNFSRKLRKRIKVSRLHPVES